MTKITMPSANDLFGLPSLKDDPFLRFAAKYFMDPISVHDKSTQYPFLPSSLTLQEGTSGSVPSPSAVVNSNANSGPCSLTLMGIDHDEKHSTRTIPLRDAIASSNANSLTALLQQPADMLSQYLPPSPRYTPEDESLCSPSLESLLDEADFWTPVVIPIHHEPCDGMISDYLELSEFDADPAQSESDEQTSLLTDADVVQNQRRKQNDEFLRSCNDLAHLAVSSDDVLGVCDQNLFGGFVDNAMFLSMEECMAASNEVGDVNAPHEGSNLNGELYLRLWAALPELIGHPDQSTIDPQEVAALIESLFNRAIQEATAAFPAEEALGKDLCSSALFTGNIMSFVNDDVSSPSTTLSDHPTPELDFSDFTDEETVSTPLIININDDEACKAIEDTATDTLMRDDGNNAILVVVPLLPRKRSFSTSELSNSDDDNNAKLKKHHHHCDACEESFSNMDRLITHRKRHIKETGINKCNHVNPATKEPCNKVFARSYDLFRHALVHYPEAKKTFPCPICKKPFSRSDALKRHHRTSATCKQRAAMQGLC